MSSVTTAWLGKTSWLPLCPCDERFAEILKGVLSFPGIIETFIQAFMVIPAGRQTHNSAGGQPKVDSVKIEHTAAELFQSKAKSWFASSEIRPPGLMEVTVGH